MTALHDTATTNVVATLNDWFETAVAAVTLPSWLSAPTIVFTVPETTLATPTLSVMHIGGARQVRWQGHREDGSTKARAALGIMDISCWVSRGSSNWQAQLRALVDVVEHVVTNQTSGAIIIKDYLANPTNPANTTYRVLLQDMELVNTAPDPNPDIERQRVLITYEWTLRS